MRLLHPCLFAVLSLAPAAVEADQIKQYLQMPTDLYPPEAVAAHLEGEIDVTLVAGPDGKIAQCSTSGSAALALLKTATCDLLVRRIRLSANSSPPATVSLVARWQAPKVPTAGASEPVASGYGGAIPISPGYWVFTDDFPASELGGRGGSTSVTFDIGVDGRATGCKVAKSSGSSAFDIATCDVITRRAHFIPAIGDDGRPRASTGHHTIVWRT